MLKNLPFFLVFLLVITGCKQDDITPSWLIIDSMDLSTDEVTEGANSHGITDAWVYMDGEALGVFELPARIPVLAEGEHDFAIFAGVKKNGISSTRIKYPFYSRFDTSLVLVKNQETNLHPIVKYKTNIKFELIEDFEDVGIEFIPTAESDTSLVHVDAISNPSIVKWGNNCGGIFLNQVDSMFKAKTATFLNLPKNEDVFLEIDYMNNNSMTMGVIAQNSGGVAEHSPYVLMNPQDESSMVWKKIYIDLKEDVSYEINATSYEIYLLAITDSDVTNARIYIDNIKVVCYQ